MLKNIQTRKLSISSGFVIFDQNNLNKVLLVQEQDGSFGFPKGRIEPNENLLATAKRELFEETNISANLLTIYPKYHIVSHYTLEEFDVDRKVTYFVALIDENQCNLLKQEDEILSVKFVDLTTALALLQATSFNKYLVLLEAIKFVQSKN
ncbi:NUDIX domain-containing protein [Mycoplasma corogypsi]|uniref:NUDIX domain-containing protein n=1 Tax=Mycoplasma corogypsi TaxID=2106 RepID=UPI0038733513